MINAVSRHVACKVKSVDISVGDVLLTVVDKGYLYSLRCGGHIESGSDLLFVNDCEQVLAS